MSTERKVNVEDMKKDDVTNLSKRIGEKISAMTEELAAKANVILNVYGLKAIVQIAFVKIEDETKVLEAKTSKKKTKKKASKKKASKKKKK